MRIEPANEPAKHPAKIPGEHIYIEKLVGYASRLKTISFQAEGKSRLEARLLPSAQKVICTRRGKGDEDEKR